MRGIDRGPGVTVQLTDRESEVLTLAVQGLSNQEIATRLDIKRRTVEAHMQTLFRKTGVHRRAQLAALYGDQDDVTAINSPQSAPRDARGGQDLPAVPLWQRNTSVDCERQVRFYAAAVRGLIDRQFPLFEERVEITLIIGEQDGQDAVVERRWTKPREYLVYRVLSPIIAASTGGSSIQPEDIALACFVNGQDTRVEVHPVWDVNGQPVAMILFQPGIQKETEWVLRYRSPQLWDPLRRSGEDTLTWATATLDQRHQPTINELTLKVIFPASWEGGQITEQSNFGVVHAERLPNAQRQVTWHHEAPGAGAYHWVLRGAPGI